MVLLYEQVKQPTSDTNGDTNGLIPDGNIEPAAHIPSCFNRHLRMRMLNCEISGMPEQFS